MKENIYTLTMSTTIETEHVAKNYKISYRGLTFRRALDLAHLNIDNLPTGYAYDIINEETGEVMCDGHVWTPAF